MSRLGIWTGATRWWVPPRSPTLLDYSGYATDAQSRPHGSWKCCLAEAAPRGTAFREVFVLREVEGLSVEETAQLSIAHPLRRGQMPSVHVVCTSIGTESIVL